MGVTVTYGADYSGRELSVFELDSFIAALTARAMSPTVLPPTTLGSNVSGCTVTSWNTSSGTIQTSLNGDAIQLSADFTYTDAVILNGMHNGAPPQPDEACACGLRFAK